MPEPGPFGETFFDASDRAMVAASLVKSPSGGKVDTVFTPATHRLLDRDLEPRADFPRAFLVISPLLNARRRMRSGAVKGCRSSETLQDKTFAGRISCP